MPPQPSNPFQPPILNPYPEPGYRPPPTSRPMPYPIENRRPIMHSSVHRPRFASLPRSRPPVCVSRRYRSSRCRPIIHIIESDSCSSISTCSSERSYTRRCCRSHSYPRRQGTCQQQQQQPVIFLPIQCQQQPSAIKGSFQGQTQPIILPSLQVQQPHLALPSTSAIQQSYSMPQIVPARRPQLLQAGPITYVQAARPQSSLSSQLQSNQSRTRSSTGSRRAPIDCTQYQESIIIKPIPRASSIQNDFKDGRYPFDCYRSNERVPITRENVQNRQRNETRIT